MITKNIEIAEKLISETMNETLQRYAGTPELNVYAWGFREYEKGRFTVGMNHGAAFFFADDVIDICRACGCSYFLCIEDDADGNPTPCIRIL